MPHISSIKNLGASLQIARDNSILEVNEELYKDTYDSGCKGKTEIE